MYRYYTVTRTQEIEIAANSPEEAIGIAKDLWEAEGQRIDKYGVPVGRARTIDTAAHEKF